MSHGILALVVALAVAQDRPVGKVALATGTVETKAGDAASWAALAPGVEIPAGSWIRTPAKSKAIVTVSDGTELRVDENTEILLEEVRKITLKSGRFWGRLAAGGVPMQLRADRTRAETAGSIFELRHDIGKKITGLIMIQGKANVASRKGHQDLAQGYGCETNDGVLNTPDQAGDIILPTLWLNELLAARSKDDPELLKRMEIMLENLGFFKPVDPYEVGFRGLGERSVPYLLAYLKKSDPTAEGERRAAALKIIGDLASPALAPELATLLKDPEPEVRAAAARGLKRMTGQDLGFDEAYWKGEQVEKGGAAWADWLKNNAAKLETPKK